MKEKLNGKPIITFQTGPEESFLVGTEDQLLHLAKSIIEAVNSAKVDDFFGYPCRVHHLSQGILDGKGSTSIDEVVVVESDEVKNSIYHKVQNS